MLPVRQQVRHYGQHVLTAAIIAAALVLLLVLAQIAASACVAVARMI